jgi:hypothetical protein
MVEELPGFVPQVLRRDDASLLQADETVFTVMVDRWRAQMLARGLAVDTGRAGVASCLDLSNSPTSVRGGGIKLDSTSPLRRI